jgi:hypothetical protein
MFKPLLSRVTALAVGFALILAVLAGIVSRRMAAKIRAHGRPMPDPTKLGRHDARSGGHDENRAAQHARDSDRPPGEFDVAGSCQQPVGRQAADGVADDTGPKRKRRKNADLDQRRSE